MEAGSSSCRPCSRGRFAGTDVLDCEACSIGTYSDTLGQSVCSPCGSGLTTRYPGTESLDLCICAVGTYRLALGTDRDRCEPCLEGMLCDWGSDWHNLGTETGPYPVAKPGFMTLSSSPLKVYYCIVKEACPGGSPGECAAHRDGRKVACGMCEAGAYRSGHTCKPCSEGSGAALVAVAIVVALVSTVTLSFRVGRDSTSNTHGVTHILVMAGMTVSSLQVLGLFSTLSLTWLGPLRSVVEGCNIFNFQLDVLQLGCSLPSGPVWDYSYAQLLPVWFLLVLLVCLHLKKCRQPTRILVELTNAYGIVLNMFFVSVLVSTLKPFLCYSHPSGNGASMTSVPSVLCFESPLHSALLAICILSFIFVVVPFVAALLCATYKYKAMISSGGDADILQAMRWLFYRYTPQRYYYGSVLLLRSSLLCFVPVVLRDQGRLQNFFMSALIIVFLTIQKDLRPWRSAMCNQMDGFVSLILALLLQGSTPEGHRVGAQYPVLDIITILCVVILFAACLISIVCFVFRLFRVRPFYDDFMCHHKLEAAGQARYLKMLIEATSNHTVFLDSDQLKDLDVLFDTIKVRVGRLVVYLTSDTLRRPWCCGEIATAWCLKVQVARVLTGSFTIMRDEQLQDIEHYVDFSGGTLDEYGITFQKIADALRWFRDAPLPEVIMMDVGLHGTERFRLIAKSLLASRGTTGMEPRRSKMMVSISSTSSPSDTRLEVILSADPTDDEGLAAAGILELKIGELVFNSGFTGITNLHDSDDLAANAIEHIYDKVIKRAAACVVVLSASTLSCAEQLYVIVAGADYLDHTAIIPVHIPTFRFPDDNFYSAKLPGFNLPGAASDAESKVRSFFRCISVTFSIAASDQILAVQAKEVFSRLPGTGSATNPRKSKLRKSMPEATTASTAAMVPIKTPPMLPGLTKELRPVDPPMQPEPTLISKRSPERQAPEVQSTRSVRFV